MECCCHRRKCSLTLNHLYPNLHIISLSSIILYSIVYGYFSLFIHPSSSKSNAPTSSSLSTSSLSCSDCDDGGGCGGSASSGGGGADDQLLVSPLSCPRCTNTEFSYSSISLLSFPLVLLLSSSSFMNGESIVFPLLSTPLLVRKEDSMSCCCCCCS